jgi:hypothetical protein
MARNTPCVGRSESSPHVAMEPLRIQPGCDFNVEPSRSRRSSGVYCSWKGGSVGLWKYESESKSGNPSCLAIIPAVEVQPDPGPPEMRMRIVFGRILFDRIPLLSGDHSHQYKAAHCGRHCLDCEEDPEAVEMLRCESNAGQDHRAHHHQEHPGSAHGRL